jgi:hypothetical protein
MATTDSEKARARRVPRGYAGAEDRAPRGVQGGQVVADVGEHDPVVFVIGMRINRWRRVRTWWPVFTGMPKMLAELQRTDAGLMGFQSSWAGRTFLTVQYWRSAEELGAYARDTSFKHAAAWAAFNKRAAATGDVGIYHETYVVPKDRVETVYGNMPTFGLAKAFGSRARGVLPEQDTVHQRLGKRPPEYVEG